jgi:hypothetical protein
VSLRVQGMVHAMAATGRNCYRYKWGFSLRSPDGPSSLQKGDWPALTDIAGVRQWSHATWPCYECCCAKDEMQAVDFFQRSTIDDGPFVTYTVDLWEEDRDRCRIDVCVLTPRCTRISNASLYTTKSSLVGALRNIWMPTAYAVAIA